MFIHQFPQQAIRILRANQFQIAQNNDFLLKWDSVKSRMLSGYRLGNEGIKVNLR